jgi:RHS repeat-associated protein
MENVFSIPKRALALIIVFIFFSSIINTQFVLAKEYPLTYDSAGNLISGFNQYYEYDEFNRLKSIRENDENGRAIEEYWYDHNGNRVKKTHYNEDGSEEIFYYIGKGFVRKINGTDTTDTNYYYHGKDLVAKKENDEVIFFHPDHLGSTSLVTDETGDTIEKTTYLPFGEVSEGGAQGTRLYTGKELDDTNLIYYGARYYSPFLRKFIQPDTLLPDIYDPQQLNRYAYARNNPYKYVDPSGNVLDIFADVGFIAWDLVDIVRDPLDWRNHAALFADVGAMFLPFVTGAGRSIKFATKADNVVIRMAKSAKKTKNSFRLFEGASKKAKGGKISSRIRKMMSSKKGSLSGDPLEAPRKAIGKGKNIVGTNHASIKPLQRELKRSRVEYYRAKIRKGESVAPINVVEVERFGRYIDNGHHRYAAYKLEGYSDANIPMKIEYVGMDPFRTGYKNWKKVRYVDDFTK